MKQLIDTFQIQQLRFFYLKNEQENMTTVFCLLNAQSASLSVTSGRMFLSHCIQTVPQ